MKNFVPVFAAEILGEQEEIFKHENIVSGTEGRGMESAEAKGVTHIPLVGEAALVHVSRQWGPYVTTRGLAESFHPPAPWHGHL